MLHTKCFKNPKPCIHITNHACSSYVKGEKKIVCGCSQKTNVHQNAHQKFLWKTLPFFVKLNQVLIIVITLKTSSASYSWSKTQTKLMMVSFPGLITALLIKSFVVGGRAADLIFLSLFLYSSFTTPSGLHRQKKNRLLLCGSCFNQLPDYNNKVGFISFAGLKPFPLCDKFISSASGFQPAKMFPI